MATTNLSIPLIAESQQDKATTLNNALEAVDGLLTNSLTVDLSGGNVSLTSNQFTQNLAFVASGMTATRELTVPDIERGLFVVDNSGGGGFDLTVTKGATSFTLPDGKVVFFQSGAGTDDLYLAGAFELTSMTDFPSSYSGQAGNLLIVNPGEDAVEFAAPGTIFSTLDWKQSVRVATTASGTLATDFENGDTVDGVVLATGDRILIKDQGTGSENGIYTVNASGAPTRATDCDEDAEVTAGLTVVVTEGTANADLIFVLTTNDPITVGSTTLTFSQISAGASNFLTLTDTPSAYTSQANKLAAVNSGETALEFVDTLLMADGSAGAPSYSFSSDTDTGMYLGAAGEIGWALGGSLAMYLDGVGLGVGVDPSNHFHTNPGSTATAATTLANSTSNAMVRHQVGGASSLSMFMGYLDQTTDGFYWQMANGTGTTSYNMVLNPFGGNVGVGTVLPGYKLDVQNSAGSAQVNILGANTGTTDIFFSDTDADNRGVVRYDHTNDFMAFWSAGTEAMRINSSGIALIGKTSSSSSTVGVELDGATGTILATRTANPSAIFNRLGADGDVVWIRNDTSTVGSISVSGATTAYNTTSDERLKENLRDLTEGELGDIIDGVWVGRFDLWNPRGGHNPAVGFVAQQAVEFVPEMVKRGDDGKRRKPGSKNFEAWGVDQSKGVPYLWAEVQNLRRRVAELETAA